ncbi:Crp/Fnr family transcriptional regulator [Dyadobacter sp. OTU695]|uniref:Crp/Fnr family transcriptional regulator n=1 Tax=Dyadobacter sp. OTU695 TaxID=3043860 RepID=UPI00313E04EB
MEQLKEYLNQFVELSEQNWKYISGITKIYQFKKNTFFQQKNKHCTTIGFIISGCFRSVKDIDGIERTFDFAVENEFVTDYYSIIRRVPSSYDIIAVEHSEVACMIASDIWALFETDMELQKLGRKIAEETVCYNLERLTSVLYDSPQVRYEKLMQNSPGALVRVPQHFIANYLGVTKETLSRIRSRMSGK